MKVPRPVLSATTVLVLGLASAVLALGASQARAALADAAPTWPIPADAPAGPPPLEALPAAGDAPPPTDQIADPVRAAAVCGGWHLQGVYADRWSAASTWWEYTCVEERSQYFPHCPEGTGACDAVCYGFPFDCYWVTEDWTDYFYWDGSEAAFLGQSYSYWVYDDAGSYGSSSAWWDGPTAQWYLIDAHPLRVSKEGSGSGVVSSSPAGISCGDVCQENVDAGTVVTLTATADASSDFTGWWGDCSGTGACQVTMDQARWVDAIFEPKRFTLTVATAGTGSGLVYMSPGAIGCGSCQESFGVGTSVTLTPTPDTSSLFTGWSGDCSGSGPCQVTMDQARSVTATFALKTFTLTAATAGTGTGRVSSSPAGIVCGDACQTSFDAGTAVTLTATPDASSIFTGWSGDCSGTGSCQVTTDQARSVTATFALNAPPHASFTVACTGLSCTFDGTASTDSDGSLVSYAWDFGDGSIGSGATASHAYSRPGSYTVSLIVTDNAGRTGSGSKAVNPISLSARGYKLNGLQKVDLSWSGPSGTSFDAYRDGVKIATVQATAYTDNLNRKGSATHTYQVCAPAIWACSNKTTVTF
jgi:hypothetical protein